MTPAPPLPAVAPKSFHHKAADYAVIALLGGIFMSAVFNAAVPPDAPPALRRIIPALGGLFMFSSLPAGIIALCGITRLGTKGLLIKGLAGVLVPILLTAMAVPAFLKVRDASQLRTEQSLERFAQSLSATGPSKLDEVTRFDKVTAGPGRLLTAHFTIIGYKASEIDRTAWSGVIKQVRANIDKTACPRALKAGVSVIYRYADEEGTLVDEVKFDPAL